MKRVEKIFPDKEQVASLYAFCDTLAAVMTATVALDLSRRANVALVHILGVFG